MPSLEKVSKSDWGQGVAGSNPVIPTNKDGPILTMRVGPFRV